MPILPDSSQVSQLYQLLQIDVFFPITSRICDFLSILDIVYLSRTCKGLRSLYQSLIPHKWDIDRILQPFIDDPKAFRSQLGENDALVSGSLALQFFERRSWDEDGIEIFVEEGSMGDSMVEYLQSREGYLFSNAETNQQRDPDHRQFCTSVKTYVKDSSRSGSQIKLHVTFTPGVPIMTILKKSLTTAIVNFISWNKAYSIYPLMTLGKHRAYMQQIHSNSPVQRAKVRKYVQRGWICEQLNPLDVHNPTQPSQPIRATRSINDRFTLTIPLSTEDVATPTTPRNCALELTNFNIIPDKLIMYGPEDATLTLHHYETAAFALSACVLRHRHVCSFGFEQWLGRVLDYKALEQLHELPLSSRPRNFAQLVADPVGLHRNLGFERPDSWRFCDDEVPEFYRLWVESVSHPLP